MEGADARLPAADVAVLARAVAGTQHGLYGYLDYLAAQVVPDTADEEHLLRWANWWGVARKAAEAASGTVTFTGISGTSIPAGTLLQRTDGTEFQTMADVAIAGGSAVAQVEAVVEGTVGNTAAGLVLRLATTLSGVQSAATIGAAGLTGGTEAETVEALRTRLRAYVQEQPQGGATNDWVTWALQVSAVTRAWAYPRYVGRGTVGLAFVCDNAPGTIIPGVDMVATVQAYLEHPDRCPPGCEPLVFAPTPAPLVFQLADLAPAQASVRLAIEAALRELVLREAEPGGTLLISHVREVISTAAGEYDHVLLYPTANVAHAAGVIATYGGTTWSES
nr:baseplate J/gp47 family protein [Nitratidesulfovibrio liaohensis]